MGSTRANRYSLLRRFTAQHCRPATVSAVDFGVLSGFHRALVVTDGTVTNLVEAYTLEPTVTECVEAGLASVDEPGFEWLGEPSGAVLRRQVLIRGRDTGAVYVTARSLLVHDRLPVSFRERLAEANGSIGTALLDCRVETHRELLWFGVQPHSTVSRASRVYVNSFPALFIEENFS